MAESTTISWCRSTFNPWLGCTKVSDGCLNCYAAVSTPARAMGIKWGAGEPRRRTSASNWKLPLRWEKQAAETGEFWPVFCSSLADVFDNEVPDEWRRDLWDLIETTPHLTWLLLTKRIGNVMRMARTVDWLYRKNVWLGITVVNQEEADRDIPKLLQTPAHKRFVSYEPALGPINWDRHLWKCCGSPIPGHPGDGWDTPPDPPTCCEDRIPGGLDWIIVGGESDQQGAKARPFDVAWARSTVAQCKAAGVACFVKQLGSNSFWNGISSPGEHWPGSPQRVDTGTGKWRVLLKDRAGADPSEWTQDLRVQEFPK